MPAGKLGYRTELWGRGTAHLVPARAVCTMYYVQTILIKQFIIVNRPLSGAIA